MSVSPRVSAALLLALFWIAGLAGGVLLERTILTPSSPAGEKGDARFDLRARGAIRGPLTFHDRLSRRLDLSEEQAGAVAELVTESQAEMAALLADVKPQLQARVDVLTQQIRELLTPDQRAAFDLMLADEQSRFRRQIEAGLTTEGTSNAREP